MPTTKKRKRLKWEIAAERLGIPERQPGEGITFLRCRKCGRVYFRIYTRFGIGRPVEFTHCGHSIGSRDLNCNAIPPSRGVRLLESQRRNRETTLN